MNRRQRIARLLWHNPIAIKEFRSRFRGGRLFLIMTIYLAITSCLTLFNYSVNATGSVARLDGAQDAGRSLFALLITIQIIIVSFIGPAFTANSISLEREQQTLDILRTTLIDPSRFLFGKLISALVMVFVFNLTLLPIQSLAFVLGGIGLPELIATQFTLAIASITFALIGLYASTASRTSLNANVLTYTLILVLLIGLPIFFMMAVPFLFVAFALLNDATGDIIWALGGFLAASANLPATIMTSYTYITQENSFLWATITSGSLTVYLPLPWLIFSALYLFLSWLLYRASLHSYRKQLNS
ncbi:MAG TPA: ABC transporter permease subunit [Anaerolineae bacterium]|nr:ABC transporter permease subunit [Anaerolineae bacterium]